jgi:hypothetical protein
MSNLRPPRKEEQKHACEKVREKEIEREREGGEGKERVD